MRHLRLFLPTLLLSGAALAQTGLAPNTDLHQTQLRLDQELFGAFNRCELEKFGQLLATDIEFYHDQGGLMLTRQAVVDATQKNICGKTRRELVAGSLEVHQMNNYGALVLGTHRFCPAQGDGRCEGIARFSHLWRFQDGTWQLTRILSFDHRPNPQ